MLIFIKHTLGAVDGIKWRRGKQKSTTKKPKCSPLDASNQRCVFITKTFFSYFNNLIGRRTLTQAACCCFCCSCTWRSHFGQLSVCSGSLRLFFALFLALFAQHFWVHNFILFIFIYFYYLDFMALHFLTTFI